MVNSVEIDKFPLVEVSRLFTQFYLLLLLAFLIEAVTVSYPEYIAFLFSVFICIFSYYLVIKRCNMQTFQYREGLIMISIAIILNYTI